MASRMAARSTTAGTPVKSCMRIRAGAKAISVSGSASASQPASASMSSGRDGDAVLVAEHVFQQHFERVRQASGSGQGVEPEDFDSSARRPADPTGPRNCCCCGRHDCSLASSFRRRKRPSIQLARRPGSSRTEDRRLRSVACIARHGGRSDRWLSIATGTPGRVVAPRGRGPHGAPGGLGGRQAGSRRSAVRGPARRRRASRRAGWCSWSSTRTGPPSNLTWRAGGERDQRRRRGRGPPAGDRQPEAAHGGDRGGRGRGGGAVGG